MVLMLTLISDQATLGYYAAAVPMAALLIIVPNSASLYAFNLGARSNEIPTVAAVWRILLGGFLIQVVSAGILAVSLPWLINLFYGDRFAPTVVFAWLLLPAGMFRGLLQALDGYLRARGKAVTGVVARSIGLGVLVGFAALLPLAFRYWDLPPAYAIPVALSAALGVCFFISGSGRPQGCRHAPCKQSIEHNEQHCNEQHCNEKRHRPRLDTTCFWKAKSVTKPTLNLSLDLDNKWAYLKAAGRATWKDLPSYLPAACHHIGTCLGQADVHSTIFVVGQDLLNTEDLEAVRGLARLGHDFGNHSFHHEPWLHLYDREKIAYELDKTDELLAQVGGRHSRGFRGPGYSDSPLVHAMLAERGYRYCASQFSSCIGPLRASLFLSAYGTQARAAAGTREALR